MVGSARRARLVVAKGLKGDRGCSWARKGAALEGTGSERFAIASTLDGELSKFWLLLEDI